MQNENDISYIELHFATAQEVRNQNANMTV